MKGLKVKDMAWLDAANGWIHFAVGGEDCYYTDALCRLTLRQRLEWSLREHGYREVWRIEAKREAWEIRSKSDVLLRGGTQRQFQQLFEERRQEMLGAFREKTAIFADASAFARLFTREMGSVCEEIEQMSDREGIFVVILPQEEEKTQRLFADGEGILGSDFLLGLRSAAEKRGAQESVFAVLERELEERFFLFPKAGKKEIQNMLFRGKVLGEWELGCKEIEEAADFLCVYLHDADLREALRYPLPNNQKMPLLMMERELSKEGRMHRLKVLLEKYRETIQAHRNRWLIEESTERAKKENAGGSFDILRREGALEEENCVELPLSYMMTVQYEDGRRESFFYPGRYRIAQGERVRRLLLIRKREHSFEVPWKAQQIVRKGSGRETALFTASGTCRAQILSYGSGMARYLLQEERCWDGASFQRMIEEGGFLEEMLRKQIASILADEQKAGKRADRLRIEERLNERWIYRNGICFSEFHITQIKRES